MTRDFLRLHLTRAVSTSRYFLPLGISKHLAILALFLVAEQNFEERAAVREAWDLVLTFPGVNARTVKKCASEADALVAYVVRRDRWTPELWVPLGAEVLMKQLIALVKETPTKAAVKERTSTLRGRKGGRVVRGRVLTGVLELLERCKFGDVEAANELAEIRESLKAVPP